jgi:hypothetical protein
LIFKFHLWVDLTLVHGFAPASWGHGVAPMTIHNIMLLFAETLLIGR